MQQEFLVVSLLCSFIPPSGESTEPTLPSTEAAGMNVALGKSEYWLFVKIIEC